MNKNTGSHGSGDVLAVVILGVGLGAVSLAAWAWLNKGHGVSDVNTLSSIGLLVMLAVVVAAALIDWLRDWRMLRVLRRHLTKTRSERQAHDPRGPKGK